MKSFDFSNRGRPPRHLLPFGAALTAIVLVGIMVYLVQTGNRLVATYAPLADAAMEIKTEATLGHLWFEEIAAGDTHESIQTVWRHFDRADWFAAAMLAGGSDAEGVYVPLTDPQMRMQITEVRDELRRFREIAEARHTNPAASFPGTQIEEDFDAVFTDLMRHAGDVESMLQRQIDREWSRFRDTQFALIGGSLLISVVVTGLLHNFERRRAEHVRELEQAHHTIKAQNESLNQMAHYDALTGLPNRALFFDRVTQAVSHSQRHGQWAVLLFIDLDRFKNVNDSLGHPIGDRLLRSAARRLRKCVRDEDTVARLAGDEFTVILPFQSTEADAVRCAVKVAESAQASLAQPFFFDHTEVTVSCSIGIAIYPQDGSTADDLLRHADVALYQAKQHGRNTHEFFSAELNAATRRRLALETGLRHAVEAGELRLHYQALRRCGTRRLRGAEALVRWEHPVEGLLPPGAFIPVAEAAGLIVPLENWVIVQACRQHRAWCAAGRDPGIVALNVSALHFAQHNLVDRIAAAINETGIDPGALEIEITESTIMSDVRHTGVLLRDLKQLGVRLAIDDFGTGYSSMAYLRTFPVDTLKIDRAFVADLEADANTRAIVEAIIGLAHKLGLEVVAEGVETEAQLAFLEAHGCDIVQGFLFHRPVPPERFESEFDGATAGMIVVSAT